jgi:hypothetical protein
MAERTVSVRLKADVAAYMASMRAAGTATQALEKASRDVRTAYNNEADAAGKLRIAQTRLSELRNGEKASALELAKAEEALATAQQNFATSSADAAGKLRVAETRLTELRKDEKASALELAKAEEALAAAQRNATTSSADAAGKLRVAETRLAELRNGEKASALELAKAEEALATAHRSFADAQDKTSAATQRWIEVQRKYGEDAGKNLGDGLTDGYTRSSQGVDKATEKVAQRTQAKFQALQWAVAFAGMPAAAVVAAGATAAALGLVPIALGAIAYASMDMSEELQRDLAALSDQIEQQARGWAAPFEQPFITATQQISGTLDNLDPLIGQAFTNSSRYVGVFTDTLDEVATRAMPGVLRATQSAGPVLRGFESLATQAASGLTDMFDNLSTGAASSGRILETTGGIVRDLEGFLGQLIANLANNGGPALDGFGNGLQTLEDIILHLTSDTSALYPAVQGFITTLDGGLGVLSQAVRLLDLLPDGVSNFGGSLFAAQKIAGLFGTSLTDTGFGLKAFSTSVDAAGNKTTPFKQALADAEKNGTSKLSAGISALGAGINPLGAALIVGASVLDIWGSKMQQRQAEAQKMQQSVADLTSALQQDNGAIGDNTRQVLAKQLADSRALSTMQALGIGTNTTMAAAEGYSGALGKVRDNTEGFIGAMLTQTNASADVQAQTKDLVDQYITGGITAEEFGSKLQGLTIAAGGLDAGTSKLVQTLAGGAAATWDAAQATEKAQKAYEEYQKSVDNSISDKYRSMSDAAYANEAATAALTGAWAALAATGGDVVAKGQAIIDVLDEMSGRHKSVEEAQQAFNQSLRDLSSEFDKAASDGSKFSQSMIGADGTINTLTETGSKLQDTLEQGAETMASYGQALKDAGTPSDQITQKLGAMRDQLAAQLKTLGLTPAEIDKVLDHYGAVPKDITTILGVEQDPRSQKQLTDIIGQLKEVPTSVGVHVSVLDGPAIQSLQQLGYKVVSLPDGTFQVFANTTDGQKAMDAFIKANQGAHVATVVDADTDAAKAKADALKEYIRKKNGVFGVDADTKLANAKVGKFLLSVVQSNPTATIWADSGPAYDSLGAWVGDVVDTSPWATLNANNQPAENSLGSWVRDASRSSPWGTINADAGPAYGSLGAWAGAVGNTHPTGSIWGDISSAVNLWDSWRPAPKIGKIGAGIGLATGGLVTEDMAPHFAAGGAVQKAATGLLVGPGTGTSDDIWLKASNHEFVVNAAATRRNLPILQAINSGAVVSGAPAPGSSASAAGAGGAAGIDVQVYIGNQQITDIVDVRISQKNRATKRSVTSGAGRSR